jgi:hypothetical protein
VCPSLTFRLRLLAVTLVVLVDRSASRAQACSPPPPALGIAYRWTLLPDRALPVPTNAAIIVSYAEIAEDIDVRLLGRIHLRPRDGVPIDVTISSGPGSAMFELHPVQSLLPRTTYEILDHVPTVPCELGVDCIKESLSVEISGKGEIRLALPTNATVQVEPLAHLCHTQGHRALIDEIST